VALDIETDMETLDAARRVVEAIDLHLIAAKTAGSAMDAVDRWVAFRLSDGVSDGALYDTKDEAMRFAPKMLGAFDTQCFYVPVPLTGMPIKEALHYLRLMRKPFINTCAPTEQIDPGFAALRTGLPSNLTPTQRTTLRNRQETT
jgi:hypothetical protein